MTWFWLFLLAGIYPYLLYPVAVWVVAVIRPRIPKAGDFYPDISVVIAAYNEELHIKETIRNKLDQDYPPDKLKIIVVSDGSDDGTDDIVGELAASDSRVTLIRQEPRQGKTAGLNLALKSISSEVTVFSDANSLYEKGAINELANQFADPEVGYVTGKMLYVGADGTVAGDGCTAYMKFENNLRALETRAGSVVGVDGGIDAVRTSLYEPMRADQLPDFVLPLSVVEQGFRVVFAPEAIVNEQPNADISDEFRMRVRVTTRALWALGEYKHLLNPVKFGGYSWQLLSHKWLRYFSFIPLGVALMISILVSAETAVIQAVYASETVFFLLALLAWRSGRVAEKFAIARWCTYFLMLNLSSAVAAFNWFTGKRFVTWQPRVG